MLWFQAKTGFLSTGDFQLLQFLVGRFPAGKLNDKQGKKSEGKSMEEAQALSLSLSFYSLQLLQSQHFITTLPYRPIWYYHILSNLIESIAGIWLCIMPCTRWRKVRRKHFRKKQKHSLRRGRKLFLKKQKKHSPCERRERAHICIAHVNLTPFNWYNITKIKS